MDDQSKTPDEWAAQKGVPRHVLVGLKHLARWVAGDALMTEAEFDQALAAFNEEPIR